MPNCPLLMALFPLIFGLPTAPGTSDIVTFGGMAKDMVTRSDGSLAFVNGSVTSYDADHVVIDYRGLTSAEIAFLDTIEEHLGRRELRNWQRNSVDEWGQEICSPPVACTKSSTCSGSCSNCVKVGWFPISFCAQ
ncbi:hypothetical protein LIA77_00351 [Sarocladium implicatum]|nr:hypothetical protein LIA77_00351 [Sarocladium implicatum]